MYVVSYRDHKRFCMFYDFSSAWKAKQRAEERGHADCYLVYVDMIIFDITWDKREFN